MMRKSPARPAYVMTGADRIAVLTAALIVVRELTNKYAIGPRFKLAIMSTIDKALDQTGADIDGRAP